MGFEKKIAIKKLNPQSGEWHWMGERNLLVYDQDFESHLATSTLEFYNQKAEIWT